MANTRRESILATYRKALELRRDYGCKETDPLCAIDFAGRCGVEVWFLEAKSMEGLYRASPEPVIVLGAYRPAGRQAFTCAHELGHHVFRHGFHVDELDYSPKANRQEFLADMFAASLLMPKAAVQRAFYERGWKPATASPLEIYAVACFLGVGYGTLVEQMSRTLNLLPADRAQQLLRVQPKTIKEEVLGRPVTGDLIIANEFWNGRPIDLRVGDILILPEKVATSSPNLVRLLFGGSYEVFEAIQPGMGQVHSENPDWSQFVHICRKDYVGLAAYRHLEENDDDGD